MAIGLLKVYAFLSSETLASHAVSSAVLTALRGQTALMADVWIDAVPNRQRSRQCQHGSDPPTPTELIVTKLPAAEKTGDAELPGGYGPG